MPQGVPNIPPRADEGGPTLKRKAGEIADSEDEENEVDSEQDLGVLDEFLVNDYAPELEQPG